MRIDLGGQVAWITGGSSGIGKAIAIETAKCGAKVAITARDEDDLIKVVNEIKSHGGMAIPVAADVSSSADVEGAVQKIINAWGQLDFVCANAGINGTWTPIDELAPEEWNKTIDLNLTGTYLTIHHAVPYLKKQGKGSILIMSSVNGTRMFSNIGASAYAVSKAGQLALGQMLALELAPSKIRVNIICPGAFKSAIHDQTEKRHLDKVGNPAEFPQGTIPLIDGDMADPVYIANLAVFLASDLAGHISGTPIWIDGAQSLLQG